MRFKVTSITPDGSPLEKQFDSAKDAITTAKQWIDRKHAAVSVFDRDSKHTYGHAAIVGIVDGAEKFDPDA